MGSRNELLRRLKISLYRQYLRHYLQNDLLPGFEARVLARGFSMLPLLAGVKGTKPWDQGMFYAPAQKKRNTDENSAGEHLEAILEARDKNV